MTFAHTTIHVTDIDRSIAFYSRLGMEVDRRFPVHGHEIAFLGSGETKLELVSDGKGAVDYPGISVGFVCEDAGALAKDLDEKCVGPISPGPGVEFWFVRDPDGFLVQIMRG